MLCLRETLTYSPEYRKTKEEFFKIFQFQATFLGPELLGTLGKVGHYNNTIIE
jgi:hypothetical protein